MRILIVDDDTGTLNAPKACLVSVGHEVVVMKNPFRALIRIAAPVDKSPAIDVLVTDLNVPGMDQLGRPERPSGGGPHHSPGMHNEWCKSTCSIPSPQMRMASNACVVDSVLMQGVRVWKYPRLHNAILDKYVVTPPGVVISHDAEEDRRCFTVTDLGMVGTLRRDEDEPKRHTLSGMNLSLELRQGPTRGLSRRIPSGPKGWTCPGQGLLVRPIVLNNRGMKSNISFSMKPSRARPESVKSRKKCEKPVLQG